MDWNLLIKTRKFKIIASVAITIFVIVIIITTVNLSHRNGKTKIKISYSPSNAEVYIDDEGRNVNNKTVYLAPGQHKIIAYADDYIYSETQYYVTKYTTTITGTLLSVNATEEEIQKYQEEQDKNSYIATQEMMEKIKKEYPIVEYLPINPPSKQYSIQYTFDQDYKNFEIVVGLGTKNDLLGAYIAQDILKNLDKEHQISQYKVTFKDISNPFTDKFENNQEPAPLAFLESGYATVKNRTIREGVQEGDYYYTIIEKYDNESQKDETGTLPYRVIMKKEKDSWQIVGGPDILLTKHNASTAPIEIIDRVNFYKDTGNQE